MTLLATFALLRDVKCCVLSGSIISVLGDKNLFDGKGSRPVGGLWCLGEEGGPGPGSLAGCEAMGLGCLVDLMGALDTLLEGGRGSRIVGRGSEGRSVAEAVPPLS